MEVPFAPEREAKLNRIATQSGKGADNIVQDLVARYLDYDMWSRQEVEKGITSLNNGRSISHEEVRRSMERILGS